MPDAFGDTFRTANEIHVPVGRPVTLRITSADVIHSFWVPELHGKMDLIPGLTDELQVEAQEAGVFHGRCAEFCGLAHAQMRLVVVAQPEDAFDRWLERESARHRSTSVSAPDRSSPTRAHRGTPSAGCSTRARSSATSDRTSRISRHDACSRRTSSPTRSKGLARWIVDPCEVKPGTKMPDVGLDGDDLDDIIELLLHLE